MEERRDADDKASEEAEIHDPKSRADFNRRSGTAAPSDNKWDRVAAPVEGARGAEVAEHNPENVAVAQPPTRHPSPTAGRHEPCIEERTDKGHLCPSEGAQPKDSELIQWSDTFLSVADCLCLAAVSRAHRVLAMQLWDQTLESWSEVIESLADTLEMLDEDWEQ